MLSGGSDVPHDTPVSPSVSRVTPPVDGTRWRFKPRTTCASWAFYGASLGGGVVLGTVAEIQLSRLFSGMKKMEWEHNGNGKLPARNARIQLDCSLLYFTNHTAAVMQDMLVTSLKKMTFFFTEHSIIPLPRKEEVKGTLNCPTKFVSL